MFFTEENLQSIDMLTSFAGSIQLNTSIHSSWESCLLELFHKTDEMGRSALHYVCSETQTASSISLLQLILRLGGSPNCQDEQGQTPLTLLLTWCYDPDIRFTMTKMLLEAGANPNLYPPGSLTPLMTAVLLDDITLVDLLVTHGADVNTRFLTDAPLLVQNRATALSLCANYRQSEILTYFLLRKGISGEVMFHALLKADPESKLIIRHFLKA